MAILYHGLFGFGFFYRFRTKAKVCLYPIFDFVYMFSFYLLQLFVFFLGKTTHLSRISKEAQLPKFFEDVLRSLKVSQFLTPRITKPR